MPYVFLDPADYTVGKPISFEEYAQLVENANEAYGGATNHGEVFATRASITGVGVTVSGATPGPYTFTVPAGVARMVLEIVGGGGGGKASGANAGNGGNSVVSGSTSGTIATANGGIGATAGVAGAGGAASGRTLAGGAASKSCGGGAAGPHAPGIPGDNTHRAVGGFGGVPGIETGTGIATPTGYGNGGGAAVDAVDTRCGGGAAGGRFVIDVIPGETLTLTVGAGGAAGGFGQAGAPGMIRLSW